MNKFIWIIGTLAGIYFGLAIYDRVEFSTAKVEYGFDVDGKAVKTVSSLFSSKITCRVDNPKICNAGGPITKEVVFYDR
jgi:hypothetical protein